MSEDCARNIFTIPAGIAFVDSLAKGILDQASGDPMALARMQVLLPTRRACRSLRDAFLKLSDNAPRLLPRMNPIGDVDEEELSLTLAGVEEDLSLPPAIAPLQRQFLLARLIAAQGQGRGMEQDLALAAALGRLMDQVYTENLDFKNLPGLVDRSEFSQHWQISLDFLRLISEFWPAILAERGVIDAADRRNRLLNRLAEYWENSPPVHPVIAAGSTGSIPATARLLKAVACMPNGAIVLPGLDQVMEDAAWKAMDATHPQATLRTLIDKLDTERMSIPVWPAAEMVSNQEERAKVRALVSEIMRPAETTESWQSLPDRVNIARGDFPVHRYDCANTQEEALVIALALRETLEDKSITAALVTPDRRLARRVAMACRRWGIEIDDSAGQALPDTRIGVFLRQAIEAVQSEMRPVALLGFLKNGLCQPSSFPAWRSSVRDLDRYVFRGPAFQGGFSPYKSKLEDLAAKGIKTDVFASTLSFINAGFSRLTDLAAQGRAPLSDWLEAHIETAEYFCPHELLWSGQDGDAASGFLSELRLQAELMPPLDIRDYLAVLDQTMKGIAVRPAYGLHPRLTILGQLEARLVGADVMILGGLNEKTWPPDPGLDPWMSRPMRAKFNLPPLERSIGLAAHDFAQCLCAKSVIITRSLRVDGTPTVPSRWLQRMDTVLQACGLKQDSLQDGPLLGVARALDHTGDYRPFERPEPRPPVSARPRQLSVTRIETWMADPYSIYARHILKLRPLDPLEQKLDAAMRGTLIHAVCENFVAAVPDRVPPDAQQVFMTIARAELDKLQPDEDIRAFWEPRLSKIGTWLIAHEKAWRDDFKPKAREAEGTYTIDAPAGGFTLTARADRIDLKMDGNSAAIIDYKSGGSYSVPKMKAGFLPQLPLEALILEAGGFASVKAVPVESLSYWIVNGGKDGGSLCQLAKPQDLDEARDNARDGLAELVARFDHADTPYYSLPRPEQAPRYNDYEHLARVREWTALGDQEDTA